MNGRRGPRPAQGLRLCKAFACKCEDLSLDLPAPVKSGHGGVLVIPGMVW